MPTVCFDVFQPKSESEVPVGTISRAKATCPACRAVTPPDRIKAQLRSQKGGADVEFDSKGSRARGASLVAVVLARPGKPGRAYRAARDSDYKVVAEAQRRLRDILAAGGGGEDSVVPDESLPPAGALGFRVQPYGMTRWADLFTARQLTVMLALTKRIRNAGRDEALTDLLCCILSRCADKYCSRAFWNSTGEKVEHSFSRNDVGMVWTFAEVNPFSDETGNLSSSVDWVAEVVEAWPASGVGRAEVGDAIQSPLPDASCQVWFTDPPYYDAIPYSGLSDFFYVWLKRANPNLAFFRSRNGRTLPLVPKLEEIVADGSILPNSRPKDRVFFENKIASAFAEGRRVLVPEGVGCVVFAHKTTEGWEALLSALVKNGWVVSGSWPIATEMGTRLRAIESAVLATSVHLVCRPRAPTAPVGDWATVVQQLGSKVQERMSRLTSEGVRGADLIFACIGPAMEVYSQYSRVVDAQDREIPLGGDPSASDPCEHGFLAKVWETVGKIALEQVLGTASGGTTTLEEDARLTALFLWAIQSSTKEPQAIQEDETEGEGAFDSAGDESSRVGYSLVYDVVRRFAQPLGIHLGDWEGRIIETKAGLVRLLPISERARQLFTEEEAKHLSSIWEEASRGRQTTLFAEESPPSSRDGGARVSKNVKSRSYEEAPTLHSATTLDRLHRAMLMQANGASGPLRRYLQEERKRPDFERLARSLTALYPKESEERRLLEALALVVPK